LIAKAAANRISDRTRRVGHNQSHLLGRPRGFVCSPRGLNETSLDEYEYKCEFEAYDQSVKHD